MLREKLYPKQAALYETLIAGPARNILLYGGSRSGKTFLFCMAIATRALKAPGSRHLICRLHNIDVRTSIMMDTWPKMMRTVFPGVPYQLHRSDQFCVLGDGAEVWFAGVDDADRIDKVLGKEYATVYVNESSQVVYATILTLRTRLAQTVALTNGRTLKQRFFADLNPVGRTHWTYVEFVNKRRPENNQPLADPESRAVGIMNPEDNPDLAEEYLEALDELPERQRMRFKLGKYLTELPGSLWPLDLIEELRVSRVEQPDVFRPVGIDLHRICTAVDPSGSDGVGGDMQGIVTVGVGVDGHGYVIRDDSCRLSPEGWGRRAVDVYHAERADVLVAEKNYGGAMVENTIRVVDSGVNFKGVDAARGKHVRAEPVAALYELKRMHHVGVFPELEEQMGMFTTAGYQGSASPDRVDALVWAVTELLVERGGLETWIRLAS